MSSTIGAGSSFDEVYSKLLDLPPPLLPPGKSHDPALTDTIASLYVHPTLEAALHLLNADLPSAHFLCRHMQAAPMYEGMYLHGILHRIEGDYNNARAWYGNVAQSDVFGRVWPSKDEALGFIAEIQIFNETAQGDKGALERRSVSEIRGVVDYCIDKYGKAKISDASSAWKQSEDEEHKKLGRDMVSGGKGFRKF